MNNTLKTSLFSILFLAIGFIGGFVVYNEHLLPAGDEAVDVQEEVVQDKNEEVQEANSEMITYTSEKLGVFFQYPKTEGQTIKIIENGNKITMSGNGYGSFEVISKPINEALEDSIAKLEPNLIKNPYCFLDRYYFYGRAHKYILSYPYRYLLQDVAGDPLIANAVKKFADTGACYSDYYYIYDNSTPDRFIKASYSHQSVEYVPIIRNWDNTGKDIQWIETLRFTEN